MAAKQKKKKNNSNELPTQKGEARAALEYFQVFRARSRPFKKGLKRGNQRFW